MAQTTLSELTYNGQKVIVEVARRDAQGRVIDTTYATKGELSKAYTLPIATEEVLGGIKVGSGLSINPETGVLSVNGGGTADAVDWSNVVSRPFNSLSTADFKVAENELQILDTKWATRDWVEGKNYLTAHQDISGKLDVETFNDWIDTTAPATYVAIDGFKADYLDANKVAYKTDIPSLTNYALQSWVNTQLESYAKNEAVYTKSQVDSLITTLKKNNYQVVDAKPEAGEEGIVYLVGTKAPYQMFVWEGSGYISLGSTSIDLSGYVPTSRKVNGKALTADISLAKADVGLGNVANTGDSAEPAENGTDKFTTGGAFVLQQSIDGKQGKLTAGTNIKIEDNKISCTYSYTNPVAATDVELDLQ